MMDKMRPLWILLPLLAQGALSQGVFRTEPQELTVVHAGDSVRLECVLYNEATCAWKLEGSELADGFLNSAIPESLQISAVDNNVRSTDCTITLDNVDERYNGKYTCSPFTSQGQTDSRAAEVVIARKPDRVELLGDAAGVFSLTTSADEPTQVSCRATNARPKADIDWYLGNDQIYEGIDVELQEDPSGLVTTVSLLTHQFSKADNGARLRCVANHAGYDETDNREAAVLIDVQFVPYRPEGNEVGKIYGFTEQQEGQVTVNFTANPPPQIMTWRVGDNTVVSAGGQSLDQRFTSSQLETVNASLGMYSLTLTISPVLLEDQSKEFVLRLENAVGHGEIKFSIGTGAAPPPPALTEGTIAGIIIAVLVVLLIIGLLVVGQRRGKWCFAD